MLVGFYYVLLVSVFCGCLICDVWFRCFWDLCVLYVPWIYFVVFCDFNCLGLFVDLLVGHL